MQRTLDGAYAPHLPPVRTTDGHIVEYDRNRIVRQIVEETKLVETFYGYEGATVGLAQEIARDVEQKIRGMGLKSLSGPLIREIVNIALLERGLVQYRNVCTRVGTPVYDAHLIDVGRGFEAHDNATCRRMPRPPTKRRRTRSARSSTSSSSPRRLPTTISRARCISTTSSISAPARSARTGTSGTSSTMV